MVKPPHSPTVLLSLLWQRKVRMLVVFALVVAATVGVIYVFPRSYESEAKLLVRVGRESVTLDPTATIGQTMQVQRDRRDEMNSVLEVLKSHAMTERVYERLGSDAFASDDEGTPPPWAEHMESAKATIKRALRMPELSASERAIHLLQDSVRIDSPSTSSVINIRATAKTPRLAQQIAEAYCEVYLEEHVRLHHAPGAYTFFAEQTEKLAQELAAAESALRTAMNDAKLLSVEGRRATLEAQIGAVENSLLANEREAISGRAKIAAIEERLALVPAMVIAQSTDGIAHAAADGMRQQLYDLEIRERKMQQEYSADHPEMIAVRKQLDEVRKILKLQSDNRTQVTNAANPAHQQLTLEKLTQETRLAALTEEAEKLAEQYAGLQATLRELNDAQPKLAEMQRRVEVLAANYRAHAERLEQSRLDQALASDAISNVRIFQPAAYLERPATPRVVPMLFLGLLAATIAAFGSAFLGDLPATAPAAAPQLGRVLAEMG